MNISQIQGIDPIPVATVQSANPQNAALPSPMDKPIYYSPALSIDPKTGQAIIEIRNSTTGAVTAQYPSEKDIEAYAQRSLKPVSSPQTDTAPVTQTKPDTAAVSSKAVAAQTPAQPASAQSSGQSIVA